MLKPDQFPEEEPEQDAPEDWSPSFDDLMMLVFSGPMRLEDANEADEHAAEEEGQTGEKSN